MLSGKLGPIGSQRDHSQPAAGGSSQSPQPATKPTQQSLAIQVAVLTEKLMQAEDTINDLRRREEAAKKASQVLVNELKVGQSDNLIRGLREDIIMLKKTREMDNTILKTQCNEILQAVQNSVKKRDNLMASRHASVSKEKYREERSPMYGEISSFPKLADLEDDQDHLPFKASAKKGSYRAISTDFAEDDQSTIVEDLRAKIHSLQKTLRVKESKISELSALLAGGEVTPRGAEPTTIPSLRHTVYLKNLTILGTLNQDAKLLMAVPGAKPEATPVSQVEKGAQFPSLRSSALGVECAEELPAVAFVQTWPGLAGETESTQVQGHPVKPTGSRHGGLPIQTSLISSSNYNLLRVDEPGQERDTHTPQDGAVRRDLRHMFEEYPSPHRDHPLVPHKVRSTKGGLFSGCTTPVQGKQTTEPAGFLRTASRGSLLNGDGGFKLVVGRFQSVGEGWMDEGRPLPMFDSIQTQMGRTGAKSSRTNLEIPGNNAEILETKAEDQLCDDSLLDKEEPKGQPSGLASFNSKKEASKKKNTVVPPLNLRPMERNLDINLPTPNGSLYKESECKVAPLQSKASSIDDDSDILKEFTDPDTFTSMPLETLQHQSLIPDHHDDKLSQRRISNSRKQSQKYIDAKENTPPPGFKNSQHSKSASGRKSPFLNAEPLTPGAFLEQRSARDSTEVVEHGQLESETSKPTSNHYRGLSNTFGGNQLQTLLQNPVFRTEGAITSNSSELNLERQFEADIEYSRRVPQLESRELGINTLKDDETNHSGSTQQNVGTGFRRLHPEYGSFGHPYQNQQDLELPQHQPQDPGVVVHPPKIADSIPGDQLYNGGLIKSTFVQDEEVNEEVLQSGNQPQDWQVLRSLRSVAQGLHSLTGDTRWMHSRRPHLQEAQASPKSDLSDNQGYVEQEHQLNQTRQRADSQLFNLTKSQFPQTLTPFPNMPETAHPISSGASNLLPVSQARGVSPLTKVRRNSIGNRPNGPQTGEVSQLRSGVQTAADLPANFDLQMFGGMQKAWLPEMPIKSSYLSNNSGITEDIRRQQHTASQTYRSGYSSKLPLPRGPYIDASGVRTHRVEPNRALFEEPYMAEQPETSLQKTNYADFWQGIKRRRSISGQSNKSAVLKPSGRGNHMQANEHDHSTVTQDAEMGGPQHDPVVHRKTKSVIGTQEYSSGRQREASANRFKMPLQQEFLFPPTHQREATDLGSSQLATKRTHSIGQRSDVRDHLPNPLEKWVHIDDDRSAMGAAHSTTTSQKRHLHLKTGYCGMVKHIAIDLVEDSMSSTDRERVHRRDLFDAKSPISSAQPSQQTRRKDEENLPPRKKSVVTGQPNKQADRSNQHVSSESIHEGRRASTSLVRQQRSSKSPSMSSKKNRTKVGIAEKARQIIGKSSLDDKSHTELSVSVANSALTTPNPFQTKQQLFSHMQKVRAITEPNENSSNSLWSKPPNQRDKSQMGSYTPLRAMDSPKGLLVKKDETSNHPRTGVQIGVRNNTPLRSRADNQASNRHMSPLLSGIGKYTTEPVKQPLHTSGDEGLGNQLDQMRALAQQSVRMINGTLQNSGTKSITPQLKPFGAPLSGNNQTYQSYGYLGNDRPPLGSPQGLSAGVLPRELKKPQKTTEELFRGKENLWEVNQVDIKHSGLGEKSRHTHQQFQENPLSNIKDRELLLNTQCTPSAAKSFRGSVDMVTELLVDRVQEMEKRIASHRDKSSTKKTRPSHMGSTSSLLANSRTNL